MTNFVRSIINDLDINQLKLLDEFVNLDDEVLKSIKNKIKYRNKSRTFFYYKKISKIYLMAERLGSNPGKSCPFAVFKTGAFNRSAISPI